MFWKPSGLWTHPDFRRLWAGQTISRFGSHIGEQALRFTAIYVLQATGGQLALLATCAIAPSFVFGLLAGVWVDRLRRRPLLIASDIGRAALLFAIPALFLWGQLGINWLYLVAALTGTLTILFDTAYQAFVPTIVQREQLGEANSKLGVSDSAGRDRRTSHRRAAGSIDQRATGCRLRRAVVSCLCSVCRPDHGTRAATAGVRRRECAG